jgi:hypothetical protein
VDEATRLVVCADKLHNLRSIRRDYEALGDEIWSKFNRSYEDQKWYYTNLVESLGDTSRFQLLDMFQHEVEVFFGSRFAIEGEEEEVQYRWRDQMLLHLAAYKKDKLKISEDGIYKRNNKSYPHILP